MYLDRMSDINGRAVTRKQSMSVRVNVCSIPADLRARMAAELVVRPVETQYRRNPPAMYPYTIAPDDADGRSFGSFPYAYMRSMGHRNARAFEKSGAYAFTGRLRDEQQQVRSECIAALNRTGSCLLSMYPGFGKTAIAIEIAQRVGLRTLVIVNRIVLLQQWAESIRKFCPAATVATSHAAAAADFTIVNAINVEKMADTDRFGLVVVDECHMIVTETLSRGLLAVHPKYLLGLSATPYRSDGMDTLIDLHFGTFKIVKKLNRKHTVYVVNTGFVPEMKLGRNGKPDWNSVIESQSLSPARTRIIARIVATFKTRKFLILCKRIEQAQMIVAALGEPASTLFAEHQTYDRANRVLVATVQKAGVGFDDSTIDALILASDIQEYFVQYLGRCMRTPHVVPLVFDLVDSNRILAKHYAARRKVYIECGAEIKRLSLE